MHKRANALLLAALAEGEGGSGGGTGGTGNGDGGQGGTGGTGGGDQNGGQNGGTGPNGAGGQGGDGNGSGGGQNGGQGGAGGQGGNGTGNGSGSGQGGQGGGGNGSGDGTDTVEHWRGHSRRHEDNYKAEKTAREAADGRATAAEERLKAVLKAAGMEEDEEDPTEAVKKATAERDTAVAEARQVRAERTAEKAARGLGMDVDAALDSRAVSEALGKLEDPTDADAVKGVLEKALESNPRLKAPSNTPAPPANADLTGGGGEGESGGALTIDQRREARRKRRDDSS